MAILTAGIFPIDMGDLRVAGPATADVISSDDFHVTFRFRDDLSVHTYTLSTSYRVTGDNSNIQKYEALTSGFQPILTLDQMSITIARYDSLVSANDATPLFAYIFRGNDTLNGSIYDDVLRGFNGNDTYLVTGGDIIIETASGGVDTATTYESYTLGANVENLTLLGGAGTSGTGNALGNIISGSSAANILSGLGGNDAFRFGNNSGDWFVGNDTIDGGTGADQIQIYTTPSHDEVITDEFFANVHSVETLRFMSGGAVIDVSLGANSDAAGINRVDAYEVWFSDYHPLVIDASERLLAITLVGTPLADTFTGGAGIDAMAGGAGNDTYFAGTGDVITEAAGKGTDTVFTADSFVLAANIENLTLTGSANVNATGNASANVLTGNSGDNLLNGGAGADKLDGGLGDDTYVIDNAGDQILGEGIGGGIDTVRTSIANLTGSIYSIESRAELENITLLGSIARAVGNAGSNALTGNALANNLDGKGGADVLAGMGGNDVYIVDDFDDVVSETAAGGTDLVQASVSFSLQANVENLTLTGTGNTDGTGNALGNVLTGNDGNNRLDGGAGADTMAGGAGNDTYVVDHAGDKVSEAANAGIDGIESFITLTLGANLENLKLVGSAKIDAKGNAADNLLVGNDNANVLDGMAGADMLEGGAGDDTYVLDNAGDTVVDSGGIDTIRTSIANVSGAVYSIALRSELENITLLAGAAQHAIGNDGNNALTGNALANLLTGMAGDDRLNGGGGADTLDGGIGDDTYVIDNAGDQIVEAGAGKDTVETSIANLAGGTYSIEARPDLENITLLGSLAKAFGNTSTNVLKGNALANILDGKAGADAMDGLGGSDTYFVDDIGDTVSEATAGIPGGIDTVNASVSFLLTANLENLTLAGVDDIDGAGNELNNVIVGNGGRNVLLGMGGNDRLTANAGDDRLDGGAGSDSMFGGLGNDAYVVDSKLDVITEGLNAGEDRVESWVTHTLAANVEHLELKGLADIDATGNALANELTGNDGDNRLDGKAGADTMAGGAGDDTYVLDNINDDVIEAGGGTDSVWIGYAAVLGAQVTLGVGKLAGIENATATGAGAFNLTGDAAANELTGNGSANILEGHGGNDVLDGKGGADTMKGGDGDDYFRVDNVLDSVIEDEDMGEDTVESVITFRLDTRPAVEHLLLAGTAAISGTGNGLANELTGNGAANVLTGLAGNDTLDGLGGADRLVGGLGDDTYYVNVSGDVVLEDADAGTDVIFSSASYILALNVEELRLTGNANVNATGNAFGNLLFGNAGNNILDGKAGVDTMAGGAGNDTYRVDDPLDVVQEHPGEGIDLVESSAATYELSADIENLALVGALAIHGIGNALDNAILGNAAANTLTGGGGNDILDGGLGNDTLIGGEGDDAYVINVLADEVLEAADSGIDTVRTTVSLTALRPLMDNVENVVLLGAAGIGAVGNGAANVLTGNAGANALDGAGGNDKLVGLGGNDKLVGGTGDDELDGGAGIDEMRGGAGDDLYRVDSASDKVIEAADEGIDTVRATISLSLVLMANVENLVLDGAALAGTGNALDNNIRGNAGNNTLNGGAGADTLIGGQGNDTYVLDSATDIVTELENEGLDTVQTTATLTLAQNVENALLLLAGSIGVTGNASNNVLTGNAGNNSLAGLAGNDTLVGNAGNDELDGGAGNDTMQGGAGNDVYHVDAIGDVVTELANAGIDTVVSAIGYVLAANLENLTLAPGAGAISGTGNAFANVLTGNEADNALDGAAGNDTIAGGQGNDSLRGGDGNDSLAGGSGDDLLDGGAGTDTMAGGAGDDSYVMDAQADQILELAGEGTDTVRAGAGTGFDLGSIPEVENLVLLGAVANGYGNALDNVITGNASANQLVGAAGNDTLAGGAGTDTLLGGDGDDVLDGGSGDDVMRGGTGNDIYVVDSASDQVLEDAGAGSDTVQTVISFVLGTNLEDLVLLGAASIDGTGNAAGNSITGNAGDNRLDGKAGDDTLAGGEGDDTYVVDSTGDEVIEETGAGHDVVRSSVAYALGANVEELVITQTLAPVSGSGNALDNRLENQSTWGAILSGGAGNDTLIGGAADDTFDFTGAAGADSMAGGGGNDTYYVDDTGDTVHESSGGGFDRVILTTAPAGAYTLADHVENAELGSSVSAGVELIGNDLENALTGSSGNDALRGGNGNDLLSGGSGDDTLEGGAGFDTLVGGAGNDLYLLGSDAETIAESAGGGIDTVVTSAGYALSDNLENLTLLGTSNVDATGNGAANTLTGNAGNNRLDGKAGADTMVGMGGDDVFVVDHTGDVVVEAEGEGRDTIRTSVDYSLPANVEDMVLTAYGLAVSGNGLDNTIALDGSTAGTVTGFSISGGAGDDVLAGGAGDDLFDFSGSGGADRMTGGNGNDTYHVDNAGDVVVEAGGAGTDTMVLHADSLGILTLAANVEKGLIATGSAAAGELVGNGVDNELTGGDGADVLRGLDGDDHLDGKLGADALHGGAGDDQYELGAGDSIHEGADAGVDTVFTALATVVLMDNVENLLGTSQSSQTLSGNALGNYLRGGDGDDALYGLGGDDALQGGAGADTLVGGVGDDIYVLEDPSDTIVELADEGQDSIQIQSKVANSTFTLSFANVENIWLIGGAGGESVHGNDLDNVITGNSTNNSLYGEGGNDTLDGGGGTLDRLYGGTGDDLYVLNSGLVETLEGENEGNDTVWIHGSLTLGANIENLTLLGSNADQGWGNALDNILTGNSGNNALNGFEGNDTLDGREGRDDLQGWGGDDVLIFDPLEQDWYSGGDGFDTLKVLGSGSTLNLAANFSGSIPFYQGLEAVDLTGTGNSSLIITLGQVGEMSWDTDILKIFGDTGDSVTSTGWGSEYVVGTIVDGGVTYDTYTSSAPESTGIALWVSQDVDVFIS